MRWKTVAGMALVLTLAVSATRAALTAEQTREAQALIEQFTSPEFALRQKAVEGLIKMGPNVLPLVRATLAWTADDEVKLRCEMVIKGVTGTPRRTWEFVEEHIGDLGPPEPAGPLSAVYAGNGEGLAYVVKRDGQELVVHNGRTSRLLSTLCLYRSGYDFKRLFTISEYYDRDRPAFYRALQGVRERGMDLTGWLEYFTEGLSTQMREVQERGEVVIRRDVVVAKALKAGLKDRVAELLSFLLEKGKASVGECEAELGGNRRTLQRDLKLLVEQGFVREVSSGPTDPTKHYEPLL